jgi:hypothetical protein
MQAATNPSQPRMSEATSIDLDPCLRLRLVSPETLAVTAARMDDLTRHGERQLFTALFPFPVTGLRLWLCPLGCAQKVAGQAVSS